MVKFKMDASQVTAGLAKLSEAMGESLGRSMCVAGGKIVRDEAKIRAPKDTGRLASSIYLAYKDDLSRKEHVVYSVSWNSKSAPHGHLLEFGHWQVYQTVMIEGQWVSLTDKPLASPQWVNAKPFLRPAFDATQSRVQKAMGERGRQRLAELLSGSGGSDEP